MSSNMDQTKECILPLGDYSPITYNLLFAVPVMACLAENENNMAIWEWLYSSYMHITCRTYTTKAPSARVNLLAPYNPFVKRTLSVFLRKNQNVDKIIAKVFKKVQKGYYVHIKLDQFHLPGYKAYQKFHLNHTEVFYGYHLDKNEIMLLGYNNLTTSPMHKQTVAFEDFKNALSGFLSGNKGPFFIVYHKRTKKMDYKFNYYLTYRGYKDYCNSKVSIIYRMLTQLKKPPYAWHIPLFQTYGLKAFSDFKEILKDSGAHSANMPRFCLVVELKKLMFLRLKYMYENGLLDGYKEKYSEERLSSVIEKYNEVSKMFNISKTAYLKYLIDKKEESLLKCIDMYEKAESLEQQISSDILQVLTISYKAYSKRTNHSHHNQ